MFDWIIGNRAVVWWLMIGSGAMFGVALVGISWLAVRIPEDYFAHPRRSCATWADRHRGLRVAWVIGKNLVGLGCLFLGSLMLVLPGQGVLTILLGITLLDFPGKFRFQRWAVTRRGVVDSINWARVRAGKTPLVLDVPSLDPREQPRYGGRVDGPCSTSRQATKEGHR